MDVVALKEKTINDFIDFLHCLVLGKYLNYEFILEEVSAISLIESGDISEVSPIANFYMDNVWHQVY